MLFKIKADYILEHVIQIDLETLKTSGIKGLIFDLDNTLMAPRTGVFTPDITNWLNTVQKDFKIAIVSNNRQDNYIQKVAEISQFPIYGRAEKPQRKIIRKTLEEMGLKPNQVAVIGDRPLTDIWVGKRLGSTTILVDPLMKHKEGSLIKLLRKLERTFIKHPEQSSENHNA